MITFLGDAGVDHYIDLNQKFLGGCALNVATHFKRNSKEPAQLLYPSSLDDQLIKEHCERENINAVPLRRDGQLPCQEIVVHKNGEKNFIKYQAGIIENFKFTASERDTLAKLDGIIAAPLFSQILPLIDQVLAINSKAQFYFDFHDCSDFDYNISKIRPYLQKSSFAQFGLDSKSKHLKDDLINEGKNILITQGSGEIYYQGELFSPTPISTIVDSTGAGDAFLGAFLATKSLKDASRYATNILQIFGSF